MARIRTIKPDFFTSEDIVELEPMARLLYIALWCEADRDGRMAWKPRTFKMRYLPGDDCDIDALCDALVTRGLVCLYGDGLAYIPSFKAHQHINPREGASTFPDPDDEKSRVTDASSRVQSSSVTRREEGKGKEGKGNIDRRVEDASPPQPVDKPSRKKPKAPIPDGYKFPTKVREYGATLGFTDAELDREEQRFIRHAKQNDRRQSDWDLTAENWLDKGAEFAGKAPKVDPEKAAAALKSMFYAAAESPQLAAWDEHYRATRGRPCARDPNGGWYFETEWPPGHAPTVPKETRRMEPPALAMRGF